MKGTAMIQYLKRTWKNKFVALVLTIPCIVPIWADGDATLMAFMLSLAIPLFLAKKDWIGEL
jgi:hypothetical protein